MRQSVALVIHVQAVEIEQDRIARQLHPGHPAHPADDLAAELARLPQAGGEENLIARLLDPLLSYRCAT